MQLFERLFGRLYTAPYALLVLTTFLWAGNIVTGRFVVGNVPPIALGTLRWVVAAAILLPFAWPYLRADWPHIRKHAGLLTLLSLLGISAFNTLTYVGLQYTEAINGTILQSTGPLMIAVWTFLIFGERLSGRQLAGMLISLAGTSLIISRGTPSALLDLQFNPGDLLLLLAMLSYALYSALLKRSPAIHPLSFVTLTMGWGAVLLLPLWGYEMAAGRLPAFDAITLLSVAYTAIFASLLAHFFFYRGVELVGPNRAAPILFLIPVFVTALAILMLGERLHLFHVGGYALVIGGILLATRSAPVKI